MTKPSSILALLKYIVLILILLGLGWTVLKMSGALSAIFAYFTPKMETVVASSLESFKEQSKFSAFRASFAGVGTTKNTLGPLSTKQTLIVRGDVTYQIDFSKIVKEDLRWSSSTNTLTVKLPPIEIDRPNLDFQNKQVYGDCGVLLGGLTDCREAIEKENIVKVQGDIGRQAAAEPIMSLARDAHRRAITQIFVSPLRAAGIEAKVQAFFADDKVGQTQTRWDTSRPIADVLAEQR